MFCAIKFILYLLYFLNKHLIILIIDYYMYYWVIQ